MEMENNSFCAIIKQQAKQVHLEIPPLFVKTFMKKAPRHVYISVSNLGWWYVSLLCYNKRVLMAQRWLHFRETHKLAPGDYVVFQYDGDTLFKATLFDASGDHKKLDRSTKADSQFPPTVKVLSYFTMTKTDEPSSDDYDSNEDEREQWWDKVTKFKAGEEVPVSMTPRPPRKNKFTRYTPYCYFYVRDIDLAPWVSLKLPTEFAATELDEGSTQKELVIQGKGS